MRYLFNKNPLVIDVDLANAIGLNEAVVLQQMNYWLERSVNIIDGKKWIYNSVTQWKKQFSFMSESTISRTIKKLESLNLIFIGKYNKDRRDQTKWYSINHEALENLMKNAISQNDECNQSNCNNAPSQNESMQDFNLTKPLPEITTEITTETTAKITTDKKLNKKDLDLSELIQQPSEQVWNDYLDHRKNKKAKLTQSALNILIEHINECVKHGHSTDAVLSECMLRNWQGFKSEWLIQSQTQNKSQVVSKQFMTRSERNAEIMRNL